MVTSQFRRIIGFSLAVAVLAGCEEGDDMAQGPLEVSIQEVGDVGLEVPGSIIHDPVDDVYLVSNIVGEPGERDEEGFISRISPDGEVIDLHWIQLFGPDLALNTPRGMAIRGDTLFVADLDCVRMYERADGAVVARVCLDGASYVTDVDVGPEGSIFVVDSGLAWGDMGLEPAGTDAVYRMVIEEGRQGSTLAQSPELGNPSGLAVGSRGIFVTTFSTGEIFRLTPEGERTDVIPPSDRSFDGIVFLPDGGFAYSSSSESAVYLVTGEGQIVPLLQDVPDPGALGYDTSRNRLLVPLTRENRLLFVDLPDDTEPVTP